MTCVLLNVIAFDCTRNIQTSHDNYQDVKTKRIMYNKNKLLAMVQKLTCTMSKQSVLCILTEVSKIAISDHYLIYGVRKFPSLKANTRIIEFRDFKNLNERAFLDDIRSIGTLNLHQYASANEMWLVWKENFTKICDKHAPIKRRKIRNKSNP
jgi:hypothetical protein